MRSYKGFTLLEVLLSVAALSMIAGIAIPIYQSFQVRNDLDISAETIAHVLRRAQVLSQGVDGDTSWGISIAPNAITLFKGTSFVARDSAYDEVFEVGASLSITGISEIVFAKFSGVPQSFGSITLTSNANETRTITVNSKGAVSF